MEENYEEHERLEGEVKKKKVKLSWKKLEREGGVFKINFKKSFGGTITLGKQEKGEPNKEKTWGEGGGKNINSGLWGKNFLGGEN